METRNLSSYRIYWVEYRATSGIATASDAKILSHIGTAVRYGKSALDFFSTKDNALVYIEELKKKADRLDKSYEVRLFSDHQFGMSHISSDFKSIEIPFTTKQNEDMFIIGKEK